MLSIIKREVKSFTKKPLFWIGVIFVAFGVFQTVSPYLGTRFLAEGETITNDGPDAVYEGEVYEGYVPSTEEQRRKAWEETVRETLTAQFQVNKAEVEAALNEMKVIDITQACSYLEEKYDYRQAIYDYENASYHKGTREEINSYIAKKLENKTFSYYFARKFADFAGLYMGFFAAVMLSVLFMQDTRKNTYELLHTKSVSAGKYVAGKTAGGFVVCFIVLAALNFIFWILCCVSTRSSGFEVRLLDFITATCLYILPNMLMIVSIYGLISLLFKSPLPAVPLLLLYMVYSNMGSTNAEGKYGYYGRPLAIMVRFPGQFFDTAPPPMALFNQSFLILASIGILLISIQLWKRRRI